MLWNLTTRFARGTEDTEENNFYPDGRRRPGNSQAASRQDNKKANKQPVCESIVILARRAWAFLSVRRLSGGQKKTFLGALRVSSEAGGEYNIQTAPVHVYKITAALLNILSIDFRQ